MIHTGAIQRYHSPKVMKVEAFTEPYLKNSPVSIKPTVSSQLFGIGQQILRMKKRIHQFSPYFDETLFVSDQKCWKSKIELRLMRC